MSIPSTEAFTASVTEDGYFPISRYRMLFEPNESVVITNESTGKEYTVSKEPRYNFREVEALKGLAILFILRNRDKFSDTSLVVLPNELKMDITGAKRFYVIKEGCVDSRRGGAYELEMVIGFGTETLGDAIVANIQGRDMNLPIPLDPAIRNKLVADL